MNTKRLITPDDRIAAFVADIGLESIRTLLKSGPVRFVIDPVGPTQWKDEAICFDFWKSEVILHLAEPEQRVLLEDFPDEYVYFASQWDDGGRPIILLRQSH